MTRRIALGAGLLLIALAGWAGADRARRTFWTTNDEPIHVASARELRSGPGLVSNQEHPVLMKLLAAASLPPVSPAPIEQTRSARRLFPVVFALLVLVAGGWTAARSGGAAGLGVAALLAIDPGLRGHGALVTSDVLVTLFLVAAAAALDLSFRRSTFDRAFLVAGGVAYGLAMASKYSALPFLALFLPIAAFALWQRATARTPPRRPRRTSRAVLKPVAVALAVFVLVACLTLALVQMAAFAGTARDDFRRGVAAQFAGTGLERDALSLTERFPQWLASYATGLLWVRATSVPGERFNYFLGEVSGRGFPLYFPVALALKSPAPVVAALAGGFGAALLAGAARIRRRHATRRWRLLFLRSGFPAAVGLAYLAASVPSHLNIGVRHVFPVVPFLLVALGGIAATQVARRARTVLVALVVLLAAAEVLPKLDREISFGNVFAGGNPGLPRTLSDSNVDWAQEQGPLFERVARGDLGRVGVVALYVDEAAASRVGILGQVQDARAPVDTVFFSRHLWDLVPGLERDVEPWPKTAWARRTLVPLRRGLETRAASIEAFRDTYMLLRLNPPAVP